MGAANAAPSLTWFSVQMLSFDNACKFYWLFISRFAREPGLSKIIHNCGFKLYYIEIIEKPQEEGVYILLSADQLRVDQNRG